MSHPARPPRVVRHADIDSNKLRLARRFRQAPTAAEATAWQILRDRAIFGLKFRRQQLIAGFIVDFYCPAQRLVLELDGGAHDDPTQRERDLDRSQILSREPDFASRTRNGQPGRPPGSPATKRIRPAGSRRTRRAGDPNEADGRAGPLWVSGPKSGSLLSTTVSEASAWRRSVGRAGGVGSPSGLSVVAEGAARQPLHEGACHRETDGGEGVGEVSLRPRDGAKRFDLALGPRGEKLVTARPRGTRRSRGRPIHGDASRGSCAPRSGRGPAPPSAPRTLARCGSAP